MVWMLVKSCDEMFGDDVVNNNAAITKTPFDQLMLMLQSQQQLSGTIAVSSNSNKNLLDGSLCWIEMTSVNATSMDNFQAVNIWLWKCANMTAVRKWMREGRSLTNICQPNSSTNNYVIGPICHMLSKEEPYD